MYSLHKISVSVFLIFFSAISRAGDPYPIFAGAGEAGTGYACIMKTGFWSSFHNQAALADNNSFTFGINYENRFNINELGTRTAGVVIPAGKASLGMVYSHFGYTDFNRQMAGVACGMSLSENLSAGVQIDYFSEHTPGEYNYHQAITFETGIQMNPSEKIRLGIHLFNPLPGSLRKRYLPSSVRAGAGIFLSRILFAGTEIEMSSGNKLILRSGFEYEVAKKLWLRSGFCTDNTAFSFGLGCLISFVQFDIGFGTHERLGVTSSASLIFNIR